MTPPVQTYPGQPPHISGSGDVYESETKKSSFPPPEARGRSPICCGNAFAVPVFNRSRNRVLCGKRHCKPAGIQRKMGAAHCLCRRRRHGVFHLDCAPASIPSVSGTGTDWKRCAYQQLDHLAVSGVHCSGISPVLREMRTAHRNLSGRTADCISTWVFSPQPTGTAGRVPPGNGMPFGGDVLDFGTGRTGTMVDMQSAVKGIYLQKRSHQSSWWLRFYIVDDVL